MTEHPGYPPMGPGAGPATPRQPAPAGVEPDPGERRRLLCPLCGSPNFTTQSGSLDSDFGLTAHRCDIYICARCSHMLLFSKGRSIFDVD